MDISSPIMCNCNNSSFQYEPNDHVFTEDLYIVQVREINFLLQKGSKYCTSSKNDWQECRGVIDKALNSYCKKGLTDKKTTFKKIFT